MAYEHIVFYILIYIGSICIAIAAAKHGFLEFGRQPLAHLGFFINTATILIIGIIRKNFPDNIYLSLGVPVLFFLVFFKIRFTKHTTFLFNKVLFRINIWAQTHYKPGEILQEKADELRNSLLAQNTIKVLQDVIKAEKCETPSSKLLWATSHLELGILYRFMNLWDKSESHLQTCLKIVKQLDNQNPDKNIWDYLTTCDSKVADGEGRQTPSVSLSLDILRKIDMVLPSDVTLSSNVGARPYPNVQMCESLMRERSVRKDIVDKFANVLFRLAELNHVKGKYSVAYELYKQDLAIAEAKGDHSTANLVRKLKNSIWQQPPNSKELNKT